MMLGAIIGDIVGSKYEFNNIKSKDFPLFSDDSTYTDDSIMTIAVAKALLRSREEKKDFKPILIEEMQAYGRKYPYPKGGYGMRFSHWLSDINPKPYNSFGNGSAMRVSPCGLIAIELYEALSLAKASAEVTHNHPEGIKGAQAVAGAVFLAKQHKEKKEIADFIRTNFYNLDFTLEEIRYSYQFNETCQGTVPQAIVAFLESNSFEDAIRNAVSLGGDCDTLTAITGSIAWAYYSPAWDLDRFPEFFDIYTITRERLPKEFLHIIDEFEKISLSRKGSYYRVGLCTSTIPHKKQKNLEDEFKQTPPTISLEQGISLKEKLRKTFTGGLLNDICSSKHYVQILNDHQIGVRNYTDYFELCNRIEKDYTSLYTATLEDCLIYLTYLWRADYMSGGYPGFDHKHREEIRAARMRIADILFWEES